jgi:hypothetical protein
MVTLCTGATIRFAVDSIYIYPGGLSDLVIRDLNYLLPHGCFVARIRDFRRYITDYEGFVGIWVPYPPNKRDCKGKRYKLVCQLRPLQAKILHYDKDFLYIPPWRLR